MLRYLDLVAILSMALGISLSAATIFTYNYRDHVIYNGSNDGGTSFMFSLAMFILGILQVLSTGVCVRATKNKVKKLLPHAIVGWITTQILTMFGVSASYIILTFAVWSGLSPSDSLATVFHIVVLADLLFLIVSTIGILWMLPKLILELAHENWNLNKISQTTSPVPAARSHVDTNSIFSFREPENANREFPPSYFI